MSARSSRSRPPVGKSGPLTCFSKSFTLQSGVSINTASASFGSKETDEEVPKATWFNVAKFPTATFASTAIKVKGGGKYDVAGKLSIKGTTKDVVVPIALTQAGPATTATGSFTLKRNDYKIGEGEWTDTSMLADEVLVKFKITLTGVGAL